MSSENERQPNNAGGKKRPPLFPASLFVITLASSLLVATKFEDLACAVYLKAAVTAIAALGSLFVNISKAYPFKIKQLSLWSNAGVILGLWNAK
jgi:hypothetical protein